jgi:ABC-type Na+ efflux pump permease subunit
MMMRRFRISRVQQILRNDPTGAIELIIAICYVILPGIFLAHGHTDLPNMTSDVFSTIGFTEPRMGLFAIVLGGLQVWGAGTAWYVARASIATAISMSLAAVIVGYCLTGYAERATVPLMVGTVLAEMFVSWRCWHERPRINGH